MDGPDRPTMESSGNHPTGGSGTGRWTRSSLERSAQSTQRCAVDSTHGSAVAGLALAVGAVPNRASKIPERGPFWSNRKDPAGPGRTSQGGRGIGSQRMLRGRHVCAGQKRGRCVGKTQRGKGTKIMGIADRHGLAVALRTESASPAEATLVESTLEERVANPQAAD